MGVCPGPAGCCECKNPCGTYLVLGEDGSPFPGATVTVYDKQGGTVLGSGVTDTNGKVRICITYSGQTIYVTATGPAPNVWTAVTLSACATYWTFVECCWNFFLMGLCTTPWPCMANIEITQNGNIVYENSIDGTFLTICIDRSVLVCSGIQPAALATVTVTPTSLPPFSYDILIPCQGICTSLSGGIFAGTGGKKPGSPIGFITDENGTFPLGPANIYGACYGLANAKPLCPGDGTYILYEVSCDIGSGNLAVYRYYRVCCNSCPGINLPQYGGSISCAWFDCPCCLCVPASCGAFPLDNETGISFGVIEFDECSLTGTGSLGTNYPARGCTNVVPGGGTLPDPVSGPVTVTFL